MRQMWSSGRWRGQYRPPGRVRNRRVDQHQHQDKADSKSESRRTRVGRARRVRQLIKLVFLVDRDERPPRAAHESSETLENAANVGFTATSFSFIFFITNPWHHPAPRLAWIIVN